MSTFDTILDLAQRVKAAHGSHARILLRANAWADFVMDAATSHSDSIFLERATFGQQQARLDDVVIERSGMPGLRFAVVRGDAVVEWGSV